MADEYTVCEGGWWPPGEGGPDNDCWNYEDTQLRVFYDKHDHAFDVIQVTPEGDRGLVSIPLSAIAQELARVLTK